MSLNAKLVVVGGDVKTTEIKLKLPSTIGRGRGTSIVLPHPLVSRQHCELYEVDGQLMVRDLGSLNGTFVNNQKITESPLAPGELLTVGTVTFRAVYDSPAVVPGSQTVRGLASQKTLRMEKEEAAELTAPGVVTERVEQDKTEPLTPPADSSKDQARAQKPAAKKSSPAKKSPSEKKGAQPSD